MHIAIVTAGGAGMFCGSCMHDNTWARGLMESGHEVTLIPTYTPLRLDEHNESVGRVFFGGINVFLADRYRWWNRVPRFMTRWLDLPRIIKLATSWSVSNQASELGEMTLSMLRGEDGAHRQAVEELDTFISDHVKPDVVIFSNALLVGALRVLKQTFSGPILCVLQGDDVFLDGLSDQYRQPVINLMSEKAADFDQFLVHTEFYRDHMANYLSLPVEKFAVLPLGIDLHGHEGQPDRPGNQPFTVGYFARIAREKGLHNLTTGFRELRQMVPDAQLKIGGYLGADQKSYFEQALALAGEHRPAVTYIGSPATHEEKVNFLKSIDVLSVPTEFLEPKGLYVLEAMANGTPVVQPSHGSFPELIARTEGGLLVAPGDPQALAAGLAEMTNAPLRQKHAQNGWRNVREHYSTAVMTAKTIKLLESILARQQPH